MAAVWGVQGCAVYHTVGAAVAVTAVVVEVEGGVARPLVGGELGEGLGRALPRRPVPTRHDQAAPACSDETGKGLRIDRIMSRCGTSTHANNKDPHGFPHQRRSFSTSFSPRSTISFT
jgi:hypothetical protein